MILGTDALAVGINLFRIREVHLLEPWFNLNKIEQIIGRATRKVSHKMLESHLRNVTVYLHCAVKEIKSVIEKETKKT